MTSGIRFRFQGQEVQGVASGESGQVQWVGGEQQVQGVASGAGGRTRRSGEILLGQKSGCDWSL